MTLTSTLSRVVYAGNGAATSFPYSFAIPAADALAVVHADAQGVETTLVLGTDYSVSGAGQAGGGAVAYPLVGPPLLSGECLTLARRVALTQETDLTNQGAFYAEVHEDAFDKLTMIDQQQQDALDRALVFPVSDPTGLSPALPAAEARAGKALTFDGQGKPRASDLAGQGLVVVSDAVPRPLGTAAAGTSPDISRDDHVHPSPASDAAPQGLGVASAGTSADLSRADHVHSKTIAGPTITTPTISGGTIDNSVIGGTAPAAIAGTTITATGLVDLSGAAAGQIKFPATQNASPDANTLDDYEEGTWTPTDGSGAGLSFTITGTPRYSKIGRVVHIDKADVTYPATADANGTVITSLPFASAAGFGSAVIGWTNYGSVIMLQGNGGAVSVSIQSAAGATLTNANFSGKRIIFAYTYSI